MVTGFPEKSGLACRTNRKGIRLSAAGEVDTVFGRAWIPKDGILLVRRRR